MSGGSYNYLYARPDSGELGTAHEYQDMGNALSAAGHNDVAALTMLIAAHLTRAMDLAKELAPLHKVQEWRESGDVGPDDVTRAVLEWRDIRSRKPEGGT